MPLRLASLLALTGAALLPATVPGDARSLLHTSRSSETDLSVEGMLRGLARGQTAYVRYADLLKLPQVAVTVTGDPEFSGVPLHVTGVYLETLAKALGAMPDSNLIAAECTDRYRSHFPAEYIAQHHPILVLKVEGKTLSEWAKETHHYDPAPYAVMYQHFVPSFKVLAHEDQPQLPDNLVRLNFTTETATFTPILPHGSFAEGSPEYLGFTIAKQNCLRCHFLGESGGTKSGRTWTSLGEWAAEQPAFFEAYVKNPQKMERHAHMEGSPQYDKPTLDALAVYFRTFSDAAKKGNAY